MTNVEKLQQIKPHRIYDEVIEKIKFDQNVSDEQAQEIINELDAYDIVNAWLQWNGIIGYTSPIIKLVKGLMVNG